MAVTVRTIILGLMYLVTFIFSANFLGLGGERGGGSDRGGGRPKEGAPLRTSSTPHPA